MEKLQIRPELTTQPGPAANRGGGLMLAVLLLGQFMCIIDVAGPAVLLVVLPLVLGHEAGWPPVSFGAIAAGVLLGAGFVLGAREC